MAKKALTPVSVAGIEFDALIEESKTMNATIPTYPVESGFSVSDTIILEPITLDMVLYVSNTPVTWLHRHGHSTDRVNKICEELENLWLSKKLVKVVTSNAIYKDMGIISISIKKTKELGYAREVAIQLQKIRVTQKKTVSIPSYILKSGTTGANAGTASTSQTSAKTSGTSSSGSSSSGNASVSASTLYGATIGATTATSKI